MNIYESPDFELFDVDAASITTLNITDNLRKNGLLLCKQGCITVLLDERIYEVRAGDLLFLPPFTYAYIKRCSSDFRGMIGMTDFDFVLSSIGTISNTHSHVYIRFHPQVSLKQEELRRIEDIIGCINARKDIQTSLNPKVISAFIQALCYDIIDAYIANMPMEAVRQTRKDKIFQNFLMSLYNNFRKHRDVAYYASLQNLSSRYFTTLIRNVSGKPPLHWISMFVIIEAKHMLSNPDMSIKEVAYRLNFAERSFFGHYFKQYTGLSPSEYKSAHSVGTTAISGENSR
ncbi:MAG: helix-turn-helix domain-containing protein [Prevotella sp.]